MISLLYNWKFTWIKIAIDTSKSCEIVLTFDKPNNGFSDIWYNKPLPGWGPMKREESLERDVQFLHFPVTGTVSSSIRVYCFFPRIYSPMKIAVSSKACHFNCEVGVNDVIVKRPMKDFITCLLTTRWEKVSQYLSNF